MENAEEILQCLDEFSKLRPKEIPPELEYYLSFVARTGDPVYQWPIIKCLFREKLVNVITEFYEACPSVEIPPCPNVEIFNYEAMKGFILEKLDTFAAAPFTVQRICELLTSPRKEYNRIDKYMRALEKNILVVSTREPGNRKSTENGESVVNGLESEHGSQEMVNSLNSDINVEVDMDEKTVWHKSYGATEPNIILESHTDTSSSDVQESYISDSKTPSAPAPTTAASAAPTSSMTSPTPASTTVAESVITTRQINYIGYTNEMLVEPSTISEAQPDNSDAPTVFSLTRPTDKEEEHIYVTEDSAFVKADCSEMDTNQIIAEPITPPEPEETPHQEKSTFVEAVVESSSQATATAVTTTSGEVELEDKEVGSSSNEAAITSTQSSEMPQSSTDQPAVTNPEITASDHQEVTESNIVIGPEDMQVEDISPEPEVEAETEAEAEADVETEAEAKVETKADAETKAEAETKAGAETKAAAETKTEESTSVCPEIVIPPAEAPKSPGNLEAAKDQPEEVPVEIENTKTESPRGEEAPQIQIQTQIQNQKEEVEAPQEIVKVTESN